MQHTHDPAPHRDTRPPPLHWSAWHTLWTSVWLCALAGILYGYLSRNETVTGASLFASLVPPPILVFLEWRAKQRARERENS
jgi:hypothetical protein